MADRLPSDGSYHPQGLPLLPLGHFSSCCERGDHQRDVAEREDARHIVKPQGIQGHIWHVGFSRILCDGQPRCRIDVEQSAYAVFTASGELYT